jgi:hypothetical protein
VSERALLQPGCSCCIGCAKAMAQHRDFVTAYTLGGRCVLGIWWNRTAMPSVEATKHHAVWLLGAVLCSCKKRDVTDGWIVFDHAVSWTCVRTVVNLYSLSLVYSTLNVKAD